MTLLRSALMVLVIVTGLFGCGDDDNPGGSGGSSGTSGSGGTGGTGGTGGGGPRTDCVDVATPTGAPTFDAVFDEVLCTNTCTDSFCHGATGSGQLQLHRREAAYTALVNAAADGEECRNMSLTRVVPGDAEASLLVEKLRPNPVCGGAMPQGVEISGEGYVPEAQIMQIEAWINAGALRHPPSEIDAGDLDAAANDSGN